MRPIAQPDAGPCVWMAAGLVSYRLCDRQFDCERCPLDAALHGSRFAPAGPPIAAGADRRGHGFPDDRRYADGHTWVMSLPGPGDPRVRIGLDGFAAGLLPRPIRADCPNGSRQVEPGDVICDIEVPAGTLRIPAPVAGRVERVNAALDARPALIVESPYHEGWLVELVTPPDTARLATLAGAADACRRAALCVRHFRRRVAMHLLTDLDPVGPSMLDGGEPLTSLPEMLGGRTYLRILREILR